MFISAIILCFVAVLLVCIYHSNKFVRIVGMYFLIIAVNLVVGTLYLSRVSLYSAGHGIDYQLFFWINRLRLPHTTIVRLFNAAFSAYMLGAVLFMNYLKSLPRWGILLMLFSPVYLYVFNDPWLGRMMHIEIYTSTGWKYQLLEQVVLWSNWWNKLMIALYLLMPIAAIGFAYRKTVIWVRRKDLVVSAICIAIINGFVYFGLIQGIYYNIMFDNVNFVRLPLDYMSQGYDVILPVIMWVAIGISAFLIFFLKPYEIFDKGSSLVRKREWRQLNRNLGMILHSYKNAFWGISQFIMPYAENAEYIGSSAYFYVKQFNQARFFEEEPESVVGFKAILDAAKEAGYEFVLPSEVLDDAFENEYVDNIENGVAWHGGTAKAWANTEYSRIMDPVCISILNGIKAVFEKLEEDMDHLDTDLDNAMKALASAWVSDSRWPPAPTSPGRFNVRESLDDMYLANQCIARAMEKGGIAHKKGLYSPSLMETQIRAIDTLLMSKEYFGE